MIVGEGTGSGPEGGIDPMDRLGHMLIRAYNRDDLDPFFVRGHPNMAERPDRIVRSCFYYSVVMTPRLTAIFDNDGAGGMCTLEPHELSAIWRTPDLLAELGVSFDALRDGSAVLHDRPLSPPPFRPNMDLDPHPAAVDPTTVPSVRP